MWSSAAADYDDISFSVGDALLHTAMRLNPAPGDRVIDIATGTGMSARNAARFAAHVTGIDIADGLLAAAREISAHIDPPIAFLKADAARLPFPDSHFDRAVSTFGIMFAPDQQGAARELARVVKPGGRAVITSWAPDPAVGRVFELLSEYQDASPENQPSPMAWGDESGVAELLGDHFELSFENGVSYGYFDSTEHLWHFYARTFGPVREIVESNDAATVEELSLRFKEEHEQFANDLGLIIPRPYLLTKAERRRPS
jgi:ubiquinone/menaquinone biosynthesis C-methylase UbiE